MITASRTVAALVGIIVFATLQLLIARPTTWPILLPVLVLALGVGCALLFGFRTDDALFWEQLSLHALFVGSAVFLLFFMSEPWLLQATTIAVTLAVWWNMENLYLFFHTPERQQTSALENLGYLTALMTVFLFTAALAAARIYLTFTLATVGLAALLFSIVHAVLVLRIGKVPKARSGSYFLPMCIILAEVMGAVILLPTSFYVAGLLATIPAYLMVNLLRHTMAVTVTKRVVRRYAAIAGAALAVTLLAAPWV